MPEDKTEQFTANVDRITSLDGGKTLQEQSKPKGTVSEQNRAIIQGDVIIDGKQHKDGSKPVIYSHWGGDIQIFTGCATAEVYDKLKLELSTSEHSTEPTPPTVKKGFVSTLRRKLGF